MAVESFKLAKGATLRRLLIITLPIVAVLGGLGWYLSNGVHYVDPTPAIEVGTRYYADFKSRDVDGAFELYSDEFKAAQGENWRNFMKGMQAQWGVLESAELVGSSIAPLDHQACLALFYKTKRAAVSSDEQLLTCPVGDGEFRIVGHSLKRLDMNKTIRAGTTVDLVGARVHVP